VVIIAKIGRKLKRQRFQPPQSYSKKQNNANQVSRFFRLVGVIIEIYCSGLSPPTNGKSTDPKKQPQQKYTNPNKNSASLSFAKIRNL
jgi:hypothetical protein